MEASIPDGVDSPMSALLATPGLPPRVQPQLGPAERSARERHHQELYSVFESGTRLVEGDVLAIVDFPKNRVTHDCNGMGYRCIQMRLKKSALESTGSAKLAAMLEPDAQARFLRRAKSRHGISALPDGVTHIIDFTPPAEGPELADMTAALWLPRSTKLWFLSGHFKPESVLEDGREANKFHKRPLADKSVGATLVLGHDDNCACLPGDELSWMACEKSEDCAGIFEGAHIPPFRRIDDYCDIRHRVTIVRLLRAIAGENLLINSATRMWTLVQVAVDLEITSVVRDGVAQWFLAPPNTKFIEIFPEEAFRVGLSLGIADLMVSAFKILVAEYAVDHAAANPMPQKPQLTWSRRKRSDYGDFPQDPIEHASRAFADRMRSTLDALRSPQAFEFLRVPEWWKLERLRRPIYAAAAGKTEGPEFALMSKFDDLVGSILLLFFEKVNEALRDVAPVGHLAVLISAQQAHYMPRDPMVTISSHYADLNDYQKALCSFFWVNLKGKNEPYSTWQAHKRLGSFIRTHADQFNAQLVKNCAASRLKLGGSELDRETFGVPQFDLRQFHQQLELQVSLLCTSTIDRWDDTITMVLSDHLLLNLEENELKYLPIWAGGYDDGSGGVFQDFVPPTDMGPSEPGPAYHTGYTVATDSDASSNASTTRGMGFDRLELSDVASTTHSLNFEALDFHDSTVGGSIDANNSASTSTGPRSYAASSEQFTASENDDDFADARISQPATHQAVGQAIEAYAADPEGEGGVGASGAADTDSVVANNDDDDFYMDNDDDDEDMQSDGGSTPSGSEFSLV